MGGERVEVHRDQDHVVAGGGHLAVEEDVGAAGGVEAQPAHRVERPVLATDRVEPGDVVLEVAGGVPVAHPDLVLLGGLVLLAPGQGRGLPELEAAVDAPHRGQGGGQRRPHAEGGRASALEHLGEDVRGVDEEVPAEVLGHLRAGQLLQVLGQLLLEVAPGEVGVGLGEAGLAEGPHDLGTGEGLGEEDHVRIALLHLPDEPRPEVERLGMGVVDPECPHPLLDPEANHPEQRVPERGPRLRREVDRVDVLVLLGRILRVLDRPVRPRVEPLGVLAHPRVVGRALDREVEGDLEPQVLRALHETAEALERAEVGVHRGVAALRRADRPRAARVAGSGRERVVGALAGGAADRMDGRQVDDVESHAADVGEPLDAVVEGAVAPGHPALRAREHLVPRREGGLRAVHHHLQLAVVTGEVGPRRHAGHELAEIAVEQDVEARVLGGRARDPLERAPE